MVATVLACALLVVVVTVGFVVDRPPPVSLRRSP
jgi:hypothetical protein